MKFFAGSEDNTIDATSGRARVWSGILFIVAFYFVIVALTKPTNWGDTGIYASQIVDVVNGAAPASQNWEFGHLIWRPLGELVWRMSRFYWFHRFGNSEMLEVYGVLQSLNIFFGLVATLASFGIARRISGSVVTASLVCASFLAWNGFLNYFQTGTSYVPGLALQLVGMYLLLGGPKGQRPLWRAWLAGLALALSVCLWFPYFFGLLGVFLLGYLWKPTETDWKGYVSKSRLVWIGHTLVVCFIVGTLTFAAGALLAHLYSANQLEAWALNSGHGYQPTQRYFRVVTGLPRGLVDIGDIGLILKRYFLHDPYAAVGLRQLLTDGLWRLGLFYAAFIGVIWMIFRDRAARPVAIAFCAGWTLLLIFGVFIFEPSQPERWLPGFATLVPAVAFIFRRNIMSSVGTMVLAALFAIVWLNNFNAYRTPPEPSADDPAVARLLALKPVNEPRNLIALLSFRDNISVFFSRFPFSPLRSDEMRYLYVSDEITPGKATWQQRFAKRALATWQGNGEIWISKRLIAERPAPDWEWVEGNNPLIKWQDIKAFFRQFPYDGSLDGQDGFIRLARVPSTEALLGEEVMPVQDVGNR